MWFVIDLRGVVVAALLALVLGASGARAADAEAGKGAYAVCATCHGQQGEGNATMNGPNITVLDPWYLKRQMVAFKEGLRGTAEGDTFGAQMRPMAMTVAEDTLDDLVAYIDSLPDQPAEPTIEGDAAAGKAAYAVCAACHGPDAQGSELMGGPRLAGQNDWYLVRQLQHYKDGLRGYDPKDTFGAQMKPMAMTLGSEKAIKDVVAHINTLQ